MTSFHNLAPPSTFDLKSAASINLANNGGAPAFSA
eukprot:CAMPEP_0177552532 /NCGR_PEP_ID=MMETSP0369-20130122/66884_1 /TAXON_ID=447022 ORGANISM="Scrippsiella hangoei-like, Strain SHHI-4" /NCGR_SAMPLE_ID=MMETSP0369 /ASSEMBLY_ACC=CAM_ASM_000364 /LENGTH=34 /DNA_ID= /DNA_START= /DNA_END= /DNA_ORIENTATION=